MDIFGQDKTALDGALNRIKAIVAIPEIGETYHGKIRSIVTFGAFVEIMPGKDALLHISEIDYKRFETMEETGLKEGDEIDVKLIGMDPKTNKLKLSRRCCCPSPRGYVGGSVVRVASVPSAANATNATDVLNAKKSKTTANVIFSGGKVLKFRLKYCTITKSFLYLRCSGWGVGRCNTANSVRTGPKDR